MSYSLQEVNGRKQISFLNTKARFSFCYRYIVKSQPLTTSSIDASLYDSTALYVQLPEPAYEQSMSTQEFLGFGGIEVEGAFMRSLSGGQQYGVRTHSALDLRLFGAISEKLSVQASLTDQQMPFEPEGNTQRLQDFDRVNIQLIHPDWKLEAGDILLNNYGGNSYLRYQRQVQGVGVSTDYLSIDSASSNTRFYSSMSRSKVGTMRIEPVEGVLGPYRIQGPQNQTFIFILAGSEKVYLDGELLVRGMEHDYVIDYNAAEIQFNPSVYISKYSQILIEYEYSEQDFAHSLSSLHHAQKFEKLRISFDYYQEADNLNKPINELSNSDMEVLAATDQTAGYAYIDNIDSVSDDFALGTPLYTYTDTLVNGAPYQVLSFVQTPTEEQDLFQVGFSYLGEGNGDYQLTYSNSNQQIYEWVAPIEGQSQGAYAPLRKVILPQKRQVLELGLAYDLSKHSELGVKLSTAQFIGNRFNKEASTLDGKAVSVFYQMDQKPLFADSKWKWSYYLQLERIDSSYMPVQNFRTLSFNRDWGIDPTGFYLNNDESLLSQSIGLKSRQHSFDYGLSLRKLGEDPVAWQQNFAYTNTSVLRTKVKLNAVENQYLGEQIQWQKAFADLSFRKYQIVPGYSYEYEKHQKTSKDSLVQSFQNFDQHRFYLKSNDSAKFSYLLSHAIRNDYRPLEGVFALFEASNTSSLEGQYLFSSGEKIALSFLRKEITNGFGRGDQPQFYQGQFSWAQYFWQGNFKQDIHYQTGTTRVLERNYFFQEVALGLGTHSWSDLNNNGQKELEEFYEDETTYGDRNYIKLFNFSNTYQTAYMNLLRYRLSWAFPRKWSDQHFMASALSKLSGQFLVHLENKNAAESWQERLTVWEEGIEEASLLSSRQQLKSDVQLNRGGALSANLTWQRSARKQLLTNGFEGNEHQGFQASTMANLLEDWNMNLGYKNDFRASFSDLVEQKNYSYQAQGFTPSINWQPYKSWRVGSQFEMVQKKSLGEGAAVEVAIQKLEFRTKWIHSSQGVIEGHFGFIKVENKAEDQALNALLYDMYEGLNAGDNYVWDLTLRRKIIGDLQLNLSYNARKASDRKLVQFGSVQLSALF